MKTLILFLASIFLFSCNSNELKVDNDLFFISESSNLTLYKNGKFDFSKYANAEHIPTPLGYATGNYEIKNNLLYLTSNTKVNINGVLEKEIKVHSKVKDADSLYFLIKGLNDQNSLLVNLNAEVSGNNFDFYNIRRDTIFQLFTSVDNFSYPSVVVQMATPFKNIYSNGAIEYFFSISNEDTIYNHFTIDLSEIDIINDFNNIIFNKEIMEIRNDIIFWNDEKLKKSSKHLLNSASSEE